MTARQKQLSESASPIPALLFSVVVLLLCSLATALLSFRFVYGVGHADRPLLAVTAVLVVAGLAWVLALRSLARTKGGPGAVTAVVVVSAALAGIQVWSQPIQEVDFYRYLLDGGVTACGEDPYALSPAEQGRALETLIDLRAALAGLGGEADRGGGEPCLSGDPRWLEVVSRVPDPETRSYIAPAAQALFAALVGSAGPDPFALRVSLGGVHVAVVALLALLLAKLGRNPALAAAYGWSPLAWKELVNSAHYDGAAIALLLLAALALAYRARIVALVLLGLTAATQLIGLVLVPLWLRTVPPRRRFVSLAACAAAFGAPWLYFASLGADFGGFTHLHGPWTAEGPIFAALQKLSVSLVPDPTAAYGFAVAVLAVAVVSLCLFYPIDGGDDQGAEAVMKAGLAVTGALLLIGPTANPWYFCWLLPFLAVRPLAHWQALAVMLPLYYAQIYLDYHDLQAYARWLAAAEFTPFAVVFLLAQLRPQNSP